MPTLLASSIPEQDWKGASQVNGQSPFARNGTQGADDEGPWRPAIEKIVAMQQLGDNWDGLGAKPPTHELLECAIGMAHILMERGTEPPSAVVPNTDGTIALIWQFNDGSYGDIEIDRPFHADVMLVQPGKPAEHWEYPDA